MELHEHVLGQILGRGAIGEHPAGDPEHEPLVMAHQVGEGVQVAAPGAGEPAIPGLGARIGPDQVGPGHVGPDGLGTGGRGPCGLGPGGSVIHGVEPRLVRSPPGSGPASKSPSACLLRKEHPRKGCTVQSNARPAGRAP